MLTFLGGPADGLTEDGALDLVIIPFFRVIPNWSVEERSLWQVSCAVYRRREGRLVFQRSTPYVDYDNRTLAQLYVRLREEEGLDT